MLEIFVKKMSKHSHSLLTNTFLFRNGGKQETTNGKRLATTNFDSIEIQKINKTLIFLMFLKIIFPKIKQANTIDWLYWFKLNISRGSLRLLMQFFELTCKKLDKINTASH